MPEIIDLLMPPVDQRGTFTVNTAAESVPVVNNNSEMITTVTLGGAYKWFQPGDNLKILSFGIVLPDIFKFCQTVANGSFPFVSLSSFDGVTSQGLGQFGSFGSMPCPVESVEIQVGTFIDAPSLSATWQILSHLGSIEVSMVNVPVAYNTKVYTAYPYIKVLHNTPLSVAP